MFTTLPYFGLKAYRVSFNFSISHYFNAYFIFHIPSRPKPLHVLFSAKAYIYVITLIPFNTLLLSQILLLFCVPVENLHQINFHHPSISWFNNKWILLISVQKAFFCSIHTMSTHETSLNEIISTPNLSYQFQCYLIHTYRPIQHYRIRT